MVCHATTRIAPTALSHQLPFTTGTQDSLAISGVSVDNTASPNIKVTFSVANSAGAVATIAATDLRFYVAGLIPYVSPGAASNTFGSDFFYRWLYERSATGYTFGTFTNNGGGSYTYTSAGVIGSAPADSTIQRIFLRVSKTGMNTADATYDFNKSDAAMASVANPRDIIPSAACNACHVARIADHGHGGGYNITEACVVCHSPLYSDPANPTLDMAAEGFDLPTMVHQIHSAINHTLLNGLGMDWSAVTYPGNMKTCVTCHTGGALSDNWKNKPTRLSCGSCHTSVNFATGANHPSPGGIRTDDSQCGLCHGAAYIETKHSTAPTGMNVPEYTATMTITPPATPPFYVAGETPTVTITLKTNPGGTDVPAALYTAPKHAAGITDVGLSGARLYVYGPRTDPKPVLTVGAAVTPVPTQATQLFVPSTDANVLTDSTGFKYKLQPIPTGMKGTYLLRFYAQNYGYKSATDYVTSSNVFTPIQIGTATADKKISGDACVTCHGSLTAPFHDARHAVVFDTDECVSCHDLSGNHADALANRVHAVHAAEIAGDILGISWADVEYPVGAKNGGVKNCAVCHTSGNVQFQANVHEMSCMGCHADNPGAMDHMRQNGGKY